MTYQNGDRYEGNWHEGLKSGKGNYFFSDGSTYEGLWEDDEING